MSNQLKVLSLGVVFIAALSSEMRAESISFVRVDSNNAGAMTGWLFDDFVSTYLQDADADSDNEFAISAISGSPASPSATAICQAASQSRCMTATSGVTFAPNIFSAAQSSIGVQNLSQALVVVDSGTSVSTQFQLQPAIDPGVDTVVVTGTLQLSRANSGFDTGNALVTASAQIAGVNVILGFDGAQNIISVSYENSVVWSDEVSTNDSYNLIIERTVSSGATVQMNCASGAHDWFTAGPSEFTTSGEANASCSLSAVGYDSSLDPPPFTGLRVFVKRIVDEEEEQEPPVQVYP